MRIAGHSMLVGGGISTTGVALCSLLSLLSLAPFISLCDAPAQAQSPVVLVGSGSSIPTRLYSRWTQEFQKRSPNIQMRYVAFGTTEGIATTAHGGSDFAAGEILLSGKERADLKLVELPVALIGIVVIYNLPSLHQELRLSGEALAGIFLGHVKTWNAPQITQLNPDLTLPSMSIHVVNRPAGKGSNYVFTDFLANANASFRVQIGVTRSPKWPVGISAGSSSDMVDKVKTYPGSIGYVELQYALEDNIPQAAVLNSAGKFLKASQYSITAACEVAESPRWNNFFASLVGRPGADSYPITSFTWIYLRTKSTDNARSIALADFVDWIYADGQQFARDEGYSSLPAQLLPELKKTAKTLR
jgi:phosphate transport system substrate-binding protein